MYKAEDTRIGRRIFASSPTKSRRPYDFARTS
jgi:hypothetical protein